LVTQENVIPDGHVEGTGIAAKGRKDEQVLGLFSSLLNFYLFCAIWFCSTGSCIPGFWLSMTSGIIRRRLKGKRKKNPGLFSLYFTFLGIMLAIALSFL
jgi:hypothetical protein